MKFTTEKVKKRSETNQYIAIALIIYGLIKFFMYSWPNQFSTSNILGLSQAIILPIIGLIILISSKKKIKLIDGDFIELEEALLHIKSRGVEKKINNSNELQSIIINLDDIAVHYTDASIIKINLSDYADVDIRKEIKQQLKNTYPELI